MAERAITDLHDELEQLSSHLRTAEKSLYLASRHAQNRGLKLLLKGYAERHARFGRELARLVGEDPGHPNGIAPALPERGWLEVSTPLILGRDNRQNAALRTSRTHLDETLAAYQRLLAEDLPEQIKQVLSAQYDYMHRVFSSLDPIMGNSMRRLAVRLFKDEHEANRAVERLQQAGYRDQDIILHPVDEDVPIYRRDSQEQRRSTRRAITTAASLLGILFAVVAVLYNLVRSATSDDGSPQIASWEFWLTVLAALAVGALFGTIFGLLLGRGVSEEDASLYEDSLQPGNVLVFVWTTAEEEAAVERVLRLKHERELTV